jgi:hypothetical protein
MSAKAEPRLKSPPSSAKPKPKLAKLKKPRPVRKSPGAHSRRKGAQFERDLVNALKEAGVDAVRVPLSGMGHEASANDEFAGDIVLPWITGKREKFEAKKRAAGFATIYRWLGRHRGLFVSADRKETLVIFRFSDFVELVRDKGRLD